MQTHEESITSLLSTISPISYRAFPLRLYQTNTKFRDEMKPRFGIIRAKEFLMKDLYSFDLNSKAARQTYDLVNEQYSKIFGALKVKNYKIRSFFIIKFTIFRFHSQKSLETVE